MWQEMSIYKYDFEGDPFRINELFDERDIDVEYFGFEIDIEEMFEEE